MFQTLRAGSKRIFITRKEILHTNITMEMHLQVSKARFSYDLQGSGTRSATDLGLVNVAYKWKHVTSVSEVVYCTQSSDTSPVISYYF